MYKIGIRIMNWGNRDIYQYNIFKINNKYYVKSTNIDNITIYYSCSKQALLLIFKQQFRGKTDFLMCFCQNDDTMTSNSYFEDDDEENEDDDNGFVKMFSEFLEILDEFEVDNNLEVNKQIINTTYNNITKKLPKELVDMILK